MRGYGKYLYDDCYPSKSKARKDVRRSDKKAERAKVNSKIRAEVVEAEDILNDLDMDGYHLNLDELFI
jgi:hypothetical protein